MAHVGYIRVNPDDRRSERQLDGIALDTFFEDAVGCGNAKRPAWRSALPPCVKGTSGEPVAYHFQTCVASLREGDVLHVHSIDRLAGNMRDLQKLAEDCAGRGAEVRFHKESLVFPAIGDEKSEYARALMLQLLRAFAEFEH